MTSSKLYIRYYSSYQRSEKIAREGLERWTDGSYGMNTLDSEYILEVEPVTFSND